MPDVPPRWGDARVSRTDLPNEAWQAKRDAARAAQRGVAPAGVSSWAGLVGGAPRPAAEPSGGAFALADEVRGDFPVLERRVGVHPLSYLDSANTSQKPRQVVDAIAEHYLEHNANVARAMHVLGSEASAAFEAGRAAVAAFVGARAEEIIFTKNASEALNVAAHTVGDHLKLGPGDEIVISVLEHHSNIVPWQLLCERTGATLRWFDITDEGRLDLAGAAAQNLINERTKIVSLAWVSNVLGTVVPVAEVAALAHAVGAIMVVDASQAVPQQAADLPRLGADLVAFTAHKMLGPTGLGVLWGRYDLLQLLPPFLGGGEMIAVVTMERSTYAAPPARFEAGTPPIAQAVGLGAAVEYLNRLGMDRVQAHEHAITAYALERLAGVDGLRILGPTEPVERGGAVSFTLATRTGLEVHPHDVMQFLDSRGVAVRGGHHCARPLHQRLGVQASTRASFYLYTTPAEVDRLVDALDYTRSFFEGVS